MTEQPATQPGPSNESYELLPLAQRDEDVSVILTNVYHRGFLFVVNCTDRGADGVGASTIYVKDNEGNWRSLGLADAFASVGQHPYLAYPHIQSIQFNNWEAWAPPGEYKIEIKHVMGDPITYSVRIHLIL